MDDLDPTLVGTGLLVVAAVVWVVCAIYAYQNAHASAGAPGCGPSWQ